MERAFWLDRWKEGRIGFHQPEGHPLLPTCWPLLELAAGSRVLVPLCGKSRDIAWLAARGHAVTGVELSARAAREFHAETGIEPTVRQEPGFECYTAGNVEIRVGDLFDLSSATIAGFDAFYDRAALIALPSAMRTAYVEHIMPALTIGARGLLITLDYDAREMNGPPFAVSEAEVMALFAPHADIERLAEHDGLGASDPLRARGLSAARERAYRITRR